MEIIIGGDFYISDSFKNKSLLDNSVKNVFAEADYRIINLEAPLTANIAANEIFKTGPHLRSSSDTVLPYLRQLKIDMVTLANNHVMDYGAKGLFDTFNTLEEQHINYVGAGRNLQEASKPFSLQKKGITIAILNFAENEWSIAAEDKPGANPLDVLENVRQIHKAKTSHDKVVCIFHGGHEYYHLPSPSMVKQYHFYAESGADAIVGHHTHCIGGYEVYNNVPIIYSLGNFLFTMLSRRKEWYTGLLAKLKIEKKKPVTFDIYPVKQELETYKTTMLQNAEKNSVMQLQKELNNSIADNTLLQKDWDYFIKVNLKVYLNNLSFTNAINNRYLRSVLNRLGIGQLFLNKYYLRVMLNLMRCEAHADRMKASIKKYISEP